MKKRLFALVFAVIMIVGFSFPTFAAFKTDTRDSVVVIRVYLEEKKSGKEYTGGWGTGFFIGKQGEAPQYLVTNYHVIKEYVMYNSGELATYKNADGELVLAVRAKIRVYYDSNKYEEVYPVEYDKTKDIAVLKLAKPTTKRKPLTLKSPTDSMTGSAVYAVGYPGLSENLFTHATTSFSASDVSVTSGIISRLLVEEGTGRNRVQIDCDIKPGNSGGPLLDEDGEVIGVNTDSVRNSSSEKVAYAVNVDDVIPLLKRNNIDFDLAGSSDKIAKDSSADNDSVVENTDANESQASFNLIPWVVIGVVAVIVIAAVVVCVVLLTNKKKNSEQISVPAQPSVISNPKTPKTAYVRSLAMQHRGMRVKLKNDVQILIGRSQADCAVVFKEGTPGVSGRHCSVLFESDSGDFIITDLRSSYGTFLQNGKKLTPGIPYHLRAGDKFYLGENSNMLTLEVE